MFLLKQINLVRFFSSLVGNLTFQLALNLLATEPLLNPNFVTSKHDYSGSRTNSSLLLKKSKKIFFSGNPQRIPSTRAYPSTWHVDGYIARASQKQINFVRFYSMNAVNLDPHSVSGFVDAEGSFSLIVSKSEQYRLG